MGSGTGAKGEKKLTGVRAGEPVTTPQGPGSLLERGEALSSFQSALRKAADSEGCPLAIAGPAGIGKTRLLQAMRERALLDGFECLTARCTELESDYAFGVVRQLLDAIVQKERSRDVAFEGAGSLAIPVFDPPDVSGPPASAQPEYGRLHGLYWVMANLADVAPICLIVDDIQWIDSASAHFLSFLASRLEGLRVLLVLATRPTQRFELNSFFQHPNLLLVRPSPLSADATGTMLEGSLGESAPSLAEAVRNATGGNPYLVRELLRDLTERQARGSVIEPESIKSLGPERVSRSVMARVQHVGARAVALAEAVAVLGDGVPIETAAQLAEVEIDSAAQAADQLAAVGVFLRGRPLAFEHSIVRHALYEQMPYARREVAHGRAAVILAGSGASAEEVAAQLLKAQRGTDSTATETLLDAADAALSRGAASVAIPYLERAHEEASHAETPGVLLRLGLAEATVGDGRSVGHLQRAFEEAADPRLKATAAINLAFLLELGSRRLEGLDIARQGLVIAAQDVPELVPRLQAAVLLMTQGTIETRRRVLGDLKMAFEVAERIPDPPGALLAVLSMEKTIGRGDVAAGAEMAASALKGGLIAEITGDAPPVYLAVGALVVADRFEEALRWYDLALEDAATRGSNQGVALASAFRSWARVRSGDLLGAESDAHTVLTAVPPGFVIEPVAVASLARVLIERGDAKGALGVLDGVDWTKHDLDHVLMQQAIEARALAELALGNPRGALEELRRIEVWEREWQGAPEVWCAWRRPAALAHHALGDTQDALRLAQEALEQAEAIGVASGLAGALQVIAVIESRDKREERLREALERLEGSGAQLVRASVLCDLGAELRRTGSAVASREFLQEAFELASGCGASRLADYAANEIISAGLKPRARDAEGLDSLTPAERRVADLAADGKSNPQIAQALFVTRKTVETHLGSVYRKLGISSRAQLSTRLGSH